jgi:hypothetical protein
MSKSNRVPIYSYHASNPERYCLSQKKNIPNWNRGEVAFYAYANKDLGTIPIYEHTYNPDNS